MNSIILPILYISFVWSNSNTVHPACTRKRTKGPYMADHRVNSSFGVSDPN